MIFSSSFIQLTVCLSPTEVITQISHAGIKNNATIKCGGVEKWSGGKELAPEENERGSKMRGHCADEFAGLRSVEREGGRE